MLLKDSSHSHLWCRTVRSSNNRFFVLSRFQISSFSIRKYFLFSRLRLNENDFKAKHLTASLNIILTWWNDSKIFWSLKYFPEFPPVRGVLTEGLARWGRSGGGIYFCVGLADFLISVMTIRRIWSVEEMLWPCPLTPLFVYDNCQNSSVWTISIRHTARRKDSREIQRARLRIISRAWLASLASLITLSYYQHRIFIWQDSKFPT